MAHLKHHRLIVSLGAALALAACGNESPPESAEFYTEVDIAEEAMMAPSPAPVASRAMKAAPQMDMAAGSSAPADDTPPPDAGRMLAYEYSATVRLPSESVAGMLSAHEQRCLDAGPSVCQVLSSNISEQRQDYVYGNLEFRAARSFMTPFREGLEAEAEGSLASMSSRAEDLTRQITDTSARLEAQKTLRDRLILLLERDTDKVGDLLQIERELARVQGEIESLTSYLAALKGRVSMDRMTLSYQSIPKAITPETASPISRAFTAFFGEIAQSLGDVILFIARLVPWLLVIIPAGWALVLLVRKLRARG